MTMFPYLKDNITALEKANPALYAWLSSSQFDEQSLKTSVFVNRWGLVDWKMESGQGLFEALPPRMLYTDWGNMEKADLSASILIGTNVGYGLNHVLINSPDSHKVLVIEPNPSLLLACLGQTDYRPFFANKKLHFVVPNEDILQEYIKNLDLQYVYGKIYLRADVPSLQLGPEYARWMQTLKNRLENFSVEMITLRCRQDVMVGNELKNYRRAQADGSLLPLKDAAKGVGAVVIGAGPSLAKFAPELAKNAGYALYATALQTLPALRRHELKPHFCLALDYDDSMLSVYDRLDAEWASDIPLIYSTKVNPEVVRRYPGPTLPLWTMGGMATFVMQDREFVLDAGGNVSLTLVRLLRWMGAGSILLVGQDFAWQGTTTHVDGHHAAKYTITFDPAMHQRLKNLWGEEIISSIQYLTSKRDLENDLKKSPYRIANLYGGGVVIEGAPAVELEEARREGLLSSAPGSRERLLNALDKARGASRGVRFEPRSHIWTSSIRGLERRMQKLFRQCGQSQKEIHTLLEQALFFVRQDPLYLPYLFNETIDLAGLAKTRRSYNPADFSEFKRIGKSILAKVREVDRCVSGMDQSAA
ncbi:MAG: motility associated factor glycosyltransferase family protein [Desulfovibrio sp.]|nr:motility associated factor glycosyltransferase family protein [Desulfovibrio sp.]